MKRLAIVADSSFVVEAIRIALRQTTGFDILGYVDGRAPIAAVIAEARPDVVIVDDMDRPENAMARIQEVHAEVPDARIILLTLRMDAEWLDDAVAKGAQSIVCKAVHPVSLGTLVREIANGNVFHRMPASQGSIKVRERKDGLTNRELEILRLVSGGESNGCIARRLWVTEQTVKFHLSNIYRKLGVANRTQASHYAHVNQLLDDEPIPFAS